MQNRPISAGTCWEILRCPWRSTTLIAATIPAAGVVHGCGLVSADSGYKYPIRDGIPVMLVEVGEKYKDVAVEDLPVPPPDDN